jgi:hypothetical protein
MGEIVKRVLLDCKVMGVNEKQKEPIRCGCSGRSEVAILG